MKHWKDAWNRFWKNEEGIGTLEIILIIAVIVVIAVVFKNYIINWVKKILKSTDDEMSKYNPNTDITPPPIKE